MISYVWNDCDTAQDGSSVKSSFLQNEFFEHSDTEKQGYTQSGQQQYGGEHFCTLQIAGHPAAEITKPRLPPSHSPIVAPITQ